MRSSTAVFTALSVAACLHAVPARSAADSKEAAPPPAKSGGRLQIDKTEMDAGVVPRGQEANYVFVLKNVGTGNLNILNAKPSCGCTIAHFDAVIGPGHEGKVTATVRTETFRGPIEKAITLTCDDPAKPSTQLRLKANVVGSVVILPRPALAFPTVKTWQYAGKLIVRKEESETGVLALSELATSVPWLLASAHKVEEGEAVDAEAMEAKAGDYILEIGVGEDAPKTHGPQTVKFKTGLPREPEISIPVSVVLDTAFRVMPSPLVLRSANEKAGEMIGVLTAVLRPGLAKEKVTAIASPDPFSVKLDPTGTAGEYRAIVTWKGNGHDAPKDGNVVFRAGDDSLTVLVRMEDTGSSVPEPPESLKP